MDLPRSAYGTAIAHAGLGVTLLGLAAAGWGQEHILSMKPGDTAAIGPFTATLESVTQQNGPNYTAAVARTVVRRDGIVIATVEPASRFYPVRKMARAEAGIVTLGSASSTRASPRRPAARAWTSSCSGSRSSP